MFVQHPKLVSLFFLLLLLSSCSVERKLEGLWLIEKVQVGTDEMTPIARWTRINKDHSQSSGNGWLQHTVGSWEYNAKSKEMTLESTFGIEDEYGGFQVDFEGEKMIWTRTEDEHEVLVQLSKINELPIAPANLLMGVWKQTDSKKGQEDYLFFRWSHIVVKGKVGEGRQFGMYKTHPHANEIEIIYFGDDLEHEKWKYRLEDNNTLYLESLEDNKLLSFQRIDYIPR